MDLREMILAAPLINQKFITVENFLLKKFIKKLVVNPFIEFAVNKITQAPDNISIEHISAKVGFSQKHLIKLFKDNVGVTPKGFLKIIRFQKAINEISVSKCPNWISIALESGYYDQAHFINDFKAFSGFTPNQYMQKNFDHLNYVPVG
jgi:AraC-like DNA-binding protein